MLTVRPVAVAITAVAALFLAGCDPPYGPDEFRVSGCRRCHTVSIDSAHDLGCVTCHKGNPDGKSVSEAHAGLVARPSGPDEMATACGRCHAGEVSNAAASDHFTLRSEIGYVWQAFFPESSNIPTPSSLRIEEYPWSLQGLVSDMLRKRCLRCHVWYKGDEYTGTRRGTGCAACHLRTSSRGVPLDHRFRKEVPDKRCLSCHYGNFTGWDYYGRFEKDYPADFRAPLRQGHHILREYGVEWLDMVPDAHFQQKMSCSACHSQGPCETGEARRMVSCLSCHPADVLPESSGHTSLGIRHVECTVCHAIWAPIDTGRSLMRLDTPDYEEWLRLSVQGSSEVEELCRDESMRAFDAWAQASTQDKIDGTRRPGMWFEGFTARRFWPVVIAETTDGRLVNARPLLDLSVSYLDGKDMIMADNITPDGASGPCPPGRECIRRIAVEFFPGPDFISYLEPGLLEKPGLWLSFTPHTIGPADVFRSQKVASWLKKMTEQSIAGGINSEE